MRIDISRQQIVNMVEVLEKLVKPATREVKEKKAEVPVVQEPYVRIIDYGFQVQADRNESAVAVADLCMCCGESRTEHRMSCQLNHIYHMWREVERDSRMC